MSAITLQSLKHQPPKPPMTAPAQQAAQEAAVALRALMMASMGRKK